MSKLALFAAILGLTQALLWAAQHPLESPFYRIAGSTTAGLAEGVMYAKLMGMLFSTSLLFFPGCFRSIKELLKDRIALSYLRRALLLGFCSLAAYAYAQSKLDGVMISILISASPLSYAVALDHLKNPKSSKAERMKKYLRSIYIRIHAFLSFCVASFFFLRSDGVEFHLFASILAFVVPGLFFFGYNALANAAKAREFSRENESSRLVAAAFLLSVSSAIVLCPLILIGLLQAGHSISPSRIPSEIWLWFTLSAFIAGFVGHLFYFLTNSYFKEHDLSSASLFHHFTPIFSVLIAYVAFGSGTEFNLDYVYLAAVLCIVLFLSYFFLRRGKKADENVK